MFLHGGTLHLLFNMYALWLFGPVLERRFGSPSYAALYVAGGLSGGMLYELIGSDAPAVGASGAIFALLGALLAASYRQRNTRAGAAVFGQLGILLAINLALPLFVGNIAWQAHVGGLIAGILIAAVWDHMPLAGRRARVAPHRRRPRGGRRRPRRRSAGGVAACGRVAPPRRPLARVALRPSPARPDVRARAAPESTA